jgi:hypothetical protein
MWSFQSDVTVGNLVSIPSCIERDYTPFLIMVSPRVQRVNGDTSTIISSAVQLDMGKSN